MEIQSVMAFDQDIVERWCLIWSGQERNSKGNLMEEEFCSWFLKCMHVAIYLNPQ